jgi:acyl carrier protein
MTKQIERELRAFIAENLLFSDNPDEVAGDQSMLQAGLIDSTGVLELVAFLEGHFDIAVADAEIVPQNLDTIDALAAFVSKKVATAAPGRFMTPEFEG